MIRSRVFGLLVLPLASPAIVAAIAVTNTNDSGAGSLRQAITDANANAGFDQITFLIPGPGAHTIVPITPLPKITDSVEILGYTQPGSSPNTNGPGLPDNSVHLIEIDGTNFAHPGGSLIQDRAIDPDFQESVLIGNVTRAFRGSINAVGDGSWNASPTTL